MSKKIKCSVEVWSDTFTDKRKIKFAVSTKEEFNFDTRKQSKESGGERRLTKACGDKHLLPIHPQKGINLATLGTTAKKFKEATGINEPLNDNLPVGLVAVRAVATELTAKSLEDSPAATISPKQGVKIGFHSGLIAKRVMHDRKTQETILRETLAADPEAMANAIKYGLLP